MYLAPKSKYPDEYLPDKQFKFYSILNSNLNFIHFRFFAVLFTKAFLFQEGLISTVTTTIFLDHKVTVVLVTSLLEATLTD